MNIKFLVLLLMLVMPAGAGQAQDDKPGRSGVAVDARGNSVIDPSENVKALSEAANKRQDDLRLVIEKLIGAKIDHMKEISETLFLRNKELRESALLRVDSEAKLRAEYEALLRQAEAKRIDAIRLVDVSAAATLAQRTTEQATALATVVTQSAEVLRNQVTRAAEDTRSLVATTAATALQNQQQQFMAVTTRLAALEQAGNEAKGKGSFQDPALAAVIAEVRSLRDSRSTATGVSEGQGVLIAGIGAALAVLLALGTLLFNVLRKPA